MCIRDSDNPAALPGPQKIDHIEEPYVKASIMTPNEFVGPIMELCQSKRGEYQDIEYIDDLRRNVIYLDVYKRQQFYHMMRQQVKLKLKFMRENFIK